MNPFYIVTFCVLAACTAFLEWFKSTSAPKPYAGNKSFLSFRDNYLFVYSLMMGALLGTRCKSTAVFQGGIA